MRSPFLGRIRSSPRRRCTVPPAGREQPWCHTGSGTAYAHAGLRDFGWERHVRVLLHVRAQVRL
eukprot:12464514-Alexandrium_andersonii.AAC.1